jgi:hypothetical protein
MLVEISIALLAVTGAHEPKVLSPHPGNPTDADRVVLERAIKQCHLHEGAIYFVQYDVPREPVIKMTRANGDTEEQLTCALKYFPADFNARFGLEFEPPPQ